MIVALPFHVRADRSICIPMKQLFSIIMVCFLAGPAAANCVVLLHGLARTEASFALMETVLEVEGFTVVRPGYASTKATISELADETIPKAVAACPEGEIHFVTHSMGGILVRDWLSRNKLENLGRVVMLAPPNQGSEVIDTFAGLYLFDQINGPAASQLGTGDRSLPLALPAVDYPVGVIAGNQSLNVYFSALLPGFDDGKVSVSSTVVKGMMDHITLPVTHTFMMNNPSVITETLVFLQTGAFDPSISWADALLERFGCEGGDCLKGRRSVER
ncbi:MAG: triacylglycerol lipase [Ascidiaceihabitans sp.]|mgnify:FL=1|jgi:triacylglycerol lipase